MMGKIQQCGLTVACEYNISCYDYTTDVRGVRTQLQEQIEADLRIFFTENLKATLAVAWIAFALAVVFYGFS